MHKKIFIKTIKLLKKCIPNKQTGTGADTKDDNAKEKGAPSSSRFLQMALHFDDSNHAGDDDELLSLLQLQQQQEQQKQA